MTESISSVSLIQGGGGTPLYQVYRYVPPQKVSFLSRFGLVDTRFRPLCFYLSGLRQNFTYNRQLVEKKINFMAVFTLSRERWQFY